MEQNSWVETKNHTEYTKVWNRLSVNKLAAVRFYRQTARFRCAFWSSKCHKFKSPKSFTPTKESLPWFQWTDAHKAKSVPSKVTRPYAGRPTETLEPAIQTERRAAKERPLGTLGNDLPCYCDREQRFDWSGPELRVLSYCSNTWIPYLIKEVKSFPGRV